MSKLPSTEADNIMAMYACYWRITPQEWRKVTRSAKTAEIFFGSTLYEMDHAKWVAYWEEMQSSGRHLDIQKQWHSLHFLLTGNGDIRRGSASAPLNYVVGGGAEHQWKKGEDVTLFLTPAQVQEASQALQALSADMLRSRFDVKKFNAANIYPCSVWDASKMEWLLDVYDDVAKFFRAAAETGDIILISIC